MVSREANFKLAPRPRSQSLLRKLGCLAILCGLVFSAILVVTLMILYEIPRAGPLALCIPESERLASDKNKIVQPLFINETRFDVLATIWSPSPNVNGSSHGSGKGRVGEDQIFWKGALAENISFHGESTQNFSLPLDLNSSFLW